LQTDDLHVLDRVEEYKGRIIELRRDFHMHPELANEEMRTSGVVGDVLERLGLKVRRGVAGTGVVGLLEGKGKGKTVALRADMDALPIQDQKKVPHASRVEGRMHACGHDAHTAMLLGAAMVLADIRSQINGSVKFIFQPAEETIGGAARMIEEGVLKNPDVDAVFGLHVSPELDVGMVGIRYGTANACSDDVVIEIMGKSAHGAKPNEGIDAIVVSAQVINALQQIISRGIDPLESAALTIGTIKGGSQANIIADMVSMTGTIRALDSAVRDNIQKSIEEITANVCRAMGAKHRVAFEPGYPLLENDDAMTDLLKNAAVKIVGDKVVEIQRPRLGVEDFAYYLQRVPGAFWRLGTGNREKGIQCVAHSPYFDIDEDALPIGTAVHVQTVLDYLR
jgi:amidohydrolase